MLHKLELSRQCAAKIFDGTYATKPTLLEKATYFRKTYPEKWKKRQMELAKKNDICCGVMSDFMKEYQLQLEEEIKSKRLFEEGVASLPPSLHVVVTYLLAGPIYQAANLPQYKDLAEEVHIYNHPSGSIVRIGNNVEPRGDKSELIIHVQDSFHLMKNCRKDHEVSLVTLTASLYPDCEINEKGSTKFGKKIKSKPLALYWKAACRFNCAFVYKGFTADDLRTKYVEIKVVGRNEDVRILSKVKLNIGSVIIAGEKAFVHHENGSWSTPSEQEIGPIKLATTFPGEEVVLTIPLRNSENKGGQTDSDNNTLSQHSSSHGSARSLSQSMTSSESPYASPSMTLQNPPSKTRKSLSRLRH